MWDGGVGTKITPRSTDFRSRETSPVQDSSEASERPSGKTLGNLLPSCRCRACDPGAYCSVASTKWGQTVVGDVRPAGGPGRRPTIYDVAAVCGVAASTVSRALSRPSRVSEHTRARVVQVANELGYTTARTAPVRGPWRGSSIALIVPDITNPYFFGLIRGAERQARAAGSTLVLVDTEESPELEAVLLRRLADAVSGFVLGASRLPDDRIRELSTQVPLVLVNRDVKSIPRVLMNSAQGVRQAASHLASLGHRRVAYLAGPPASWLSSRRWGVLQAAGRRLGLELVKIGPLAPTVAAGTTGADSPLLDGVTAIVTFNDLLAVGVLLRLRERGVEVPGQVSVVGFDDIFGADFTHPPLTTISAPTETAGRGAVDLLLGALADPAGSGQSSMVLPTRLTIRESTAAAIQSGAKGVGVC